MKFSDLFQEPSLKEARIKREQRRLKAMQSIVHALQVPLSRVAPDELNCASDVDFQNDDWLIEQLERVPEIIVQIRDENQIKYDAEVEVNRESIKLKLELEERNVNELREKVWKEHCEKMKVYDMCDGLKREIERLKAELSAKEQTINVIFRDERREEKMGI